MKIILNQAIDNLGNEGEILDVKPGFARNYLIPKGWAKQATKINIAATQKEIEAKEKKEAKTRENLEALGKVLDKLSLKFELKAGEEGRLFGSVTSQMIVDAIAEKGFTLISADYNQIEMRILADLADVKELKKAFKNNEDIHSLTASQVFNLDIKKVDQDTRRKAKAINFGIIYGISQYGLAKQIMVSNNEAADFLNSYFLKFPEIKDYMNSTINFCRKSGYVNNIFGRRSHINGINDKNYNVRNFQERAAINAPIQGSAADIMRLAMIKLNEVLENKSDYNTKVLLQIHDELVFEAPDNEIKKIIPIIKKKMSDITTSEHHSFSTPLIVDINSGNNWGEAH